MGDDDSLWLVKHQAAIEFCNHRHYFNDTLVTAYIDSSVFCRDKCQIISKTMCMDCPIKHSIDQLQSGIVAMAVLLQNYSHFEGTANV